MNKAELLKKIVELVKEKRIEGISDLRDESDRDGMRMVIELKRDAMGQIVLNKLYQMTALQSTFGVIQLAIVGGRPQVLNLKEMLEHFIAHRREVVTRRTRFELREAEAPARDRRRPRHGHHRDRPGDQDHPPVARQRHGARGA